MRRKVSVVAICCVLALLSDWRWRQILRKIRWLRRLRFQLFRLSDQSNQI